jgi:hypothetical protein
MLLLIEMKGSCWGGYFGKWIVDTASETAIDIYPYRSTDKMSEPKTFKLPDISLIHCCLENTPIKSKYFASFDKQDNKVTIISPYPEKVVYHSDREIYPDNDALVAKIESLIQYLSHLKPLYS